MMEDWYCRRNLSLYHTKPENCMHVVQYFSLAPLFKSQSEKKNYNCKKLCKNWCLKAISGAGHALLSQGNCLGQQNRTPARRHVTPQNNGPRNRFRNSWPRQTIETFLQGTRQRLERIGLHFGIIEKQLARTAGQQDKNHKMSEKLLARTAGQQDKNHKMPEKSRARAAGQQDKNHKMPEKSLTRAAGQQDKNHKMP